jgi:hypothetical protein
MSPKTEVPDPMGDFDPATDARSLVGPAYRSPEDRQRAGPAAADPASASSPVAAPAPAEPPAARQPASAPAQRPAVVRSPAAAAPAASTGSRTPRRSTPRHRSGGGAGAGDAAQSAASTTRRVSTSQLDVDERPATTPDEPYANLAVRVRRSLDDRLDDLTFDLRRQGVRSSKAEIIELLLWELPPDPDDSFRARLARFREHAPRDVQP